MRNRHKEHLGTLMERRGGSPAQHYITTGTLKLQLPTPEANEFPIPLNFYQPSTTCLEGFGGPHYSSNREEISSAIKHPQQRTPFLNGDATNIILHKLTEIFQTDTALPRVPVKLVTPHGAPRVPTTVASHGSPRVHIRKLFVPHNYVGHRYDKYV